MPENISMVFFIALQKKQKKLTFQSVSHIKLSNDSQDLENR